MNALSVASEAPTKMAEVIITLKIMPERVDVDLDNLQKLVIEKITEFGGDVGKTEQEPIAFGLIAIKITFVSDESKGATDPLEEDIANLEGVAGVQTIDVRRAIG